jgi:NitT/TauT family transport system substrate-binding protein
MKQPINNVDYAHRFFLALAGASALAMAAVLPARAQQSSPAEVQTVRIAQQFGISYLPLMVIQEQKLIERFAREAGLPEPVVSWNQFSGGGTMNDALISGSLDFASAGITPMLTLWAKTRGSLEVKAVAALAALPSFLNTSNREVRSIKDLTQRDRIALPAIKVSIQATLLQMAAEQAFGVGQHARLDALTVSMPHPDATAALLSGHSEVTAHFTTPPFQSQQLENPAVHRVLSSYDILGGPHTLNLIYTTGKFATQNPRTTRAFLTALETANGWIKQNPRAAADLYIRAENSKLKPDFVEGMITDPDVHFTTVPENIMKFAEFQHRIGQIKVKPADWKEIFLPDAHGYPGS